MHPLPFPYRADLVSNAGAVVQAAVPLAWWPADTRPGRGGLDADHTGETPLSTFATIVPHVGKGHLLLADGTRLQIVSASEQIFLPHVTLRLRRVVPAA